MMALPRMLSRLAVLSLALALFIQLRLKASGVSPVSTVLPPLEEFPVANTRLTGRIEKIGENDLVGPESLVSTKHGGKEVMFASLGDGRLVRMEEQQDKNGSSLAWTTLVRTGSSSSALSLDEKDLSSKCGKGGPTDHTNTEGICGRPLGIKIVKRSTVDPTFEGKDEDVLVIADTKGLLMLQGIYGDSAADTKLDTLATRANTDAEDYKFQLLNAFVQVKDSGGETALYLTETSQVFQRRRIFHAVFDGHPTGRLLKYTKNGGVQVVLENLYMPNGIALSHDGRDLLIVAGVQILRYSLAQNKLLEPFVSYMHGTGDNIDAFDHLPSGEKRKCYWAGFGSKFALPFSLLKLVSEKPLLKAVLCALIPYDTIVKLIPKLTALAVYDEKGQLIQVYQDVNATAPWLSEGETMGDYLYLGSWFNPFVARVKIDDLKV